MKNTAVTAVFVFVGLAALACPGPSGKVSIVISPASATLNPSGTQVFTAIVTGTSNTAVSWSVQEASGGAISSSGLYTAPTTTGTFHVVATSVADTSMSATATVTVQSGPVVSVSVTPGTANLAPGATATFTATVSGTTNTSVTWSVQEGASGGSVSTGGVYTAPATFGTFHVVATSVADPTKSGAATVSVGLSSGITVSGTIHYSGAKTGVIYVTVNPPGCNGCNGSGGASLTSAGAYTIRGVQANGNVLVSAFMDTLGNQQPNSAADPAGSSATFTLNGGSVSGEDITLTDPVPQAPSVPQNVIAQPNDDAALVFLSKNATADHYSIYWVTGAGSCPTSKGAYTQSEKIVANQDTPALVRPLTHGAAYCFAATGWNNGTESALSNPFGPLTISAPTGGSTISGTVTFSGITPGGALYVAVYQAKGSNVYFADVGSPSSPQAFTITGVANGVYGIGAFIDMNNDGAIDSGDVSTGFGSGAPYVVAGNVSSVSLSLTSSNAIATVVTQHQPNGGGGDQYNLQFNVAGNLKQAIAATVTSGANLTSNLDLSIGGNGGTGGALSGFYNLGTTVPSVGQGYGIAVTYLDGTSETLSPSITGVVASIPVLTSPGPNATQVSTKPTFAWSVASPPTNAVQQLGVQPASGGNWIWQYGMSATQTQVVYDVDGTAQQALLASATQYEWQVTVQDSNGNRSQAWQQFTTQ